MMCFAAAVGARPIRAGAEVSATVFSDRGFAHLFE